MRSRVHVGHADDPQVAPAGPRDFPGRRDRFFLCRRMSPRSRRVLPPAGSRTFPSRQSGAACSSCTRQRSPASPQSRDSRAPQAPRQPVPRAGAGKGELLFHREVRGVDVEGIEQSRFPGEEAAARDRAHAHLVRVDSDGRDPGQGKVERDRACRGTGSPSRRRPRPRGRRIVLLLRSSRDRRWGRPSRTRWCRQSPRCAIVLLSICSAASSASIR